ncbi:UDP-N-acetylmuramoyl-L-alanine--D-glutamate ligase, partial [Dietzia natronolimnaea]|nr:UDP-N-acetylmuramoyl-L-alanine--D-glutamate ligase [Dietzia natronolimnaea]
MTDVTRDDTIQHGVTAPGTAEPGTAEPGTTRRSVERRRMDINDLAGARVLVLGAGVSGPGAVRILHALGAEPVVADSRPEAVELLRGALPDGVTCTGVGLDRAA